MNLARTLFLAALLLPTIALAAEPPRPEAPQWRSWNDGVSEAASRGLPILVDVYTDWCGWCKRMDRDVYARDDVREYLGKHFVAVKLNAESATEARVGDRTLTARALAQQLRVSGYPTTIFLKSSGEHIASVPGYIPADRFKLMLRYIGEDHIQRGVSWQEFEKSAAAGPIRR